MNMTYSKEFEMDEPLLLNETKLNTQRFLHFNYNKDISRCLIDILSGVVIFLLSVVLIVSYASILYPGSEHNENFGAVADMAALGSAIFGLYMALRSNVPWAVATVDVFTAPIIAQIAACIGPSENEENISTALVVVAFSFFFLGAFMIVIGSCKLAKLVNMMPYPVISGFLSGIGLTLLFEGLRLGSGVVKITDISEHSFVLLLPSLLFCMILIFSRLWSSSVITPLALLLGASTFLFYTVVWIARISISELQSSGWLLDRSVSEGRSPFHPFVAWNFVNFRQVDWKAVLNVCPYTLTLVFLGSLKYTVVSGTFETLFRSKCDVNYEVSQIGWAHVIAGLSGCIGGAHNLSSMKISQELGASHRLPGIICSILCFILWLEGLSLVEYIPKFVFSGLLLQIGVRFIIDFLIHPCRRISRGEGIILVIVATSFVAIGMLQGILLGILLSLFLVAYRLSSIGSVYDDQSLDFFRSNTRHSPEDDKILVEHANSVRILRLQGYVFFGTTRMLTDRVEQLLESPTSASVIIIDFTLVSGFDATALERFSYLCELTRRHHTDIIYCGTSPVFVQWSSELTCQNTNLHLCDSFERSLELSEDIVLEKINQRI